MKRHNRPFVSVATLCVLALAPAAAADGIDHRVAPIVDGRVATTSEFFGTVALVSTADGEANCTGTLIAPRVVATAAHCVVEQDEQTDAITGVFAPSDIAVVAGVIDTSEASETHTFALAKIVVHPDYPNESNSNHPSGAGRYDDVALLLLERAVTTVKVVPIPTIEEVSGSLSAGTMVTISGYGTTSPEGDGGGMLHIAETPFDTRVDVELVLGRAGEPDTCPGDSGGPAYLVSGSNARLVGITSRAADDAVATCGEKGVYGFAPAYRAWFVSASEGLYTAGSTPVDPVDPEDPEDPVTCDPETEDCETACDPETEDCETACDPETEDCETACDPETEDCDDACDPETEDCDDWDDESCNSAGGGTPGAWPMALLFLVFGAWRRRRCGR
jgi:uncharacterized protein (TIGR03382 family)